MVLMKFQNISYNTHNIYIDKRLLCMFKYLRKSQIIIIIIQN